MYLYLGQETVINTKDIIGIFDLDNTSVSRITKAYLAAAQKSGHIVEVSPEIPKSFVVCGGDGGTAKKKATAVNGGTTVYLSQISPATLKKRACYFKDI